MTKPFLLILGHTILHELTHLDALGGIVGLDPDNIGSRGTSDVQQDCELNGARNYLVDYIADPTLSSPDYNAESYAAAATGKTECRWPRMASHLAIEKRVTNISI